MKDPEVGCSSVPLQSR